MRCARGPGVRVSRLPKFHGWKATHQRDGEPEREVASLSVGYVPGLVRPQLYTVDGNVLWTLASFRSVKAAQKASTLLDRLILRGKA